MSAKEMKIKEGEAFLARFYEAEQVPYDGAGEKFLHLTGLKRVKRELSLEGKGGEAVISDDLFLEDTKGYIAEEKRRLSKRTICCLVMLLLLIPLTIAFGIHFMGDRKYYFISLMIMIYAIAPFIMVFEGRKPQARELIVLATMAALASAGRAAFFMVPSFKPIVAIVIISGISFGGEAGFLVGAVTMLVSNFLFGQGPWTPWQMFAMGFIGFLAGIFYRKGILPTTRWKLCLFGFLVTLFIYGGIMNPAALFMSTYEFTWTGLLAMYISGVPVDTVHACSTFIFLWIGSKPLLEKLQRIKIKYGLME